MLNVFTVYCCKPTGNLLRETHRKSSQGNPPEIFSGSPPEIFPGKPTGNLLRETHRKFSQETHRKGKVRKPTGEFSQETQGCIHRSQVRPHRRSCQRPTLNQIKSGGITVNLPEYLVRPSIKFFESTVDTHRSSML